MMQRLLLRLHRSGLLGENEASRWCSLLMVSEDNEPVIVEGSGDERLSNFGLMLAERSDRGPGWLFSHVNSTLEVF